MLRVVGIFALCATVAVGCSMGADSAMSAKSERLLIQEGSGNLKKITKSPANVGGLRALAKFTQKLTMGLSNATETTDVQSKKVALRAAAASKMHSSRLHASVHGHGVHVATAHKQLAKLAVSKLQDDGNSTADDDASPASAAVPNADTGDADAVDDRYDKQARPGWDDKNWATSDWAVWTLCGPVLTMTAAMWIFYTYGWQWALGTMLVLVAVDMFGFYYNV